MYKGDKSMKKTEVTVQVYDSFEDIDKKLKNQGFKVTGTYYLNDWYFSKNKDVKKMPYDDLIGESFLLRQVILNDGKNISKLCYKSKRLDKEGNVISEQKTECNVDDLHNALKIFDNAQLNNWCCIKNKSITYSNGTMCFDLQIIEDLGTFIEYEEDQLMKDLSAKAKFNLMQNNLQKLQLNLGKDFSCKKVFMKLHLTV